MGYKGRVQVICEVGHYFERDSGWFYYSMGKNNLCVCGKKPHYVNDVDETNGVDKRDPNTFNRPVVLVVEYDVPTRDHRDNFYMVKDRRVVPKHISQWRIYKI